MSALTPTPTNPNPPSPKVILQGLWTLLVPVLLVGILAGLGYLLTDDGKSLLAGLPPILQVIILAVVTSLSGTLAAYKVRDPLRAIGTTVLQNKAQLPDVLGKTPDQVADEVAKRLDDDRRLRGYADGGMVSDPKPRRAYVDPDVPPAE